MAITSNKENGSIKLSNEVIAKVGGIAATSCYGVVGMAVKTVKDGIVHLLKKESLSKGVEVSISDNDEISIKLHIIVEYGTSIPAIGEIVSSTVKYSVEKMLDIQCDNISVIVEGIRVNN